MLVRSPRSESPALLGTHDADDREHLFDEDDEAVETFTFDPSVEELVDLGVG